jgi:hypothetical protein
MLRKSQAISLAYRVLIWVSILLKGKESKKILPVPGFISRKALAVPPTIWLPASPIVSKVI